MTLFFSLLLLLAQAPTGADDAVVLGDRLLRSGDPGAAAAAYEDAARLAAADGQASADLELRLGTAYLRAEQLGPAVLHLERARRLRPADSLTEATLLGAREAVGVRRALPPSPLVQTALALARPVGTGALFALGWTLFLAGLAAAGWRIWMRDERWAPWDRRVLTTALPLGVLLIAAALVASAERDAARAVVQRPAALGAVPGDASGLEVPAGRVVWVERVRRRVAGRPPPQRRHRLASRHPAGRDLRDEVRENGEMEGETQDGIALRPSSPLRPFILASSRLARGTPAPVPVACGLWNRSSTTARPTRARRAGSRSSAAACSRARPRS